MTNFLATLILLVISFFVVNLFPAGHDFIGSIMDSFNQKTTNVVQEYDRLKGQVDEVTTTIKDTKEQVDKTVEAVSSAATSASKALDQVNQMLGKDKPPVPADPSQPVVKVDQKVVEGTTTK